MRKIYLSLALASCVGLGFVSSCSKEYDDSLLKGRLDKVEGRLTSVEAQIKDMNSNISALRTLVTALEKNVFVRSVTPEGDEGYRINFSDGQSVQIKHGKQGIQGIQGEAGKTPVIGVRQEAGRYYWTIDGQWLLVGGNKVPTTGEQGIQGERGLQGISPKLRIENDRWEISYDNGSSWTDLGRAKGDQGIQGERGEPAYNVFQSMNEDSNAVHILLTSGTRVSIPKLGGIAINIEEGYNLPVENNSRYTLHYTLSGQVDAQTRVYALAAVEGAAGTRIKAIDEKRGTIDVLIGHYAHEYAPRLTFLATNADGKTAVVEVQTRFDRREDAPGRVPAKPVLRFEGYRSSYTAKPTEDRLINYVQTNANYRVEIPSDVDWLRTEDESLRAYLETKQLILLTSPNTTGKMRRAEVKLVDREDNFVYYTLVVHQLADDMLTIHVAKPGSLKDMVNALDVRAISGLKLSGLLNGQDFNYLKAFKKLDLSEIENTELPDRLFEGTGIEEIKLPNRLSAIPNYCFRGSKLKSITIPEGVQSIGDAAFLQTLHLKGDVVIPSSVTSIGHGAFNDSAFDGHLILNEGLQTIGELAFSHVKRARGDVRLPNSLTSMGRYAFLGSKFGGELRIGNALSTIPESAFKGSSFSRLTLGEAITEIGIDAFANCEGLTGTLTLPQNLKYIGQRAFMNCANLSGSLHIPHKVVEVGTSAFHGCRSLSGELHIGRGVQYLKFNSFNLSGRTIEEALSQGVQDFPMKVYSHAIYAPSLFNSKSATDYNSPFGITRLTFLAIPNAPDSERSYRRAWGQSTQEGAEKAFEIAHMESSLPAIYNVIEVVIPK